MMQMLYRLVGIKYRDGGFTLWGRDKTNIRRAFRVEDFDPFYYIRRNETVPRDSNVVGADPSCVSFKGELLTKVWTRGPGDVGRLRENHDDHWEADIPIERRLLVTTEIKDFFAAPLNDQPSSNPMLISWRDLVPMDGKKI